DAEFLILLTGVDETFAQTVHARSSYKHTEVVWGAKFKDMFNKEDKAGVSVDMRLLHEIEKINNIE
ncbi:MAG: potassium transporter, partial [Ignavibacteriales bacterium]|nr:potassium transporter [Ignavibacteriales bacterium]